MTLLLEANEFGMEPINTVGTWLGAAQLPQKLLCGIPLGTDQLGGVLQILDLLGIYARPLLRKDPSAALVRPVKALVSALLKHVEDRGLASVPCHSPIVRPPPADLGRAAVASCAPSVTRPAAGRVCDLGMTFKPVGRTAPYAENPAVAGLL